VVQRLFTRMDEILTHVLPVERIVFSSSLVCAGLFRCRADDEHFPGGRPCSAHSVVFPRESVWIQHECGRRFVGDPSVATLYNRGETYRRWSIGGRPDRCDWLAFPDAMLRGAVREVAPADADAPRGPLRATSTPISAGLYAAQRQLFLHLKANPAGTEPMPVEERAMALLSAVLHSAYPTNAREPRQTRRSLEAVEQIRERIAAGASRRYSLADLVEGLDISAYHACRVFRAMTGATISEYRTQLRVRAALEPVLAGDDLTATGLSLGFDSHSHFTYAFRRAFGVPPSELRRRGQLPVD
jgi:AraC family transcriptional regulator